MEERQLTGGGAHGDGDGEVEDRVVVDGRAACLGGAGGRRQHLRLELQELPHEAEVGRNDAAALLDKLKRFVQLDAVGAHEVGEANGGRARDSSLTVHKDTSSFVSHRVCFREEERIRKRDIRTLFKKEEEEKSQVFYFCPASPAGKNIFSCLVFIKRQENSQ